MISVSLATIRAFNDILVQVATPPPRRYTVRWGRVPGSSWDAWIVRDPDGQLAAAVGDHETAVLNADWWARHPEATTGLYL